ncbi:hypothetical protein E2562_034169 [Oryza meyeriana var. granulata]|uniref:Uncharacterized protein n=1 Tax=Oryza meyeriana var. granulata TaxID=110450 RepID=A0A6G1ESB8_9ORYZ|nr:hypothetical protein E2562_034169 [Oryza meyeriana var. granulata]
MDHVTARQNRMERDDGGKGSSRTKSFPLLARSPDLTAKRGPFACSVLPVHTRHRPPKRQVANWPPSSERDGHDRTRNGAKANKVWYEDMIR